jgi:hypothetical protein
MPVSTTARKTCPTACPLFENGCYAEQGPLGMLWSALSKAKPGAAVKRAAGIMQTLTWSGFCASVAALPLGTLWRHNQAGDLPGKGNAIDGKALAALVAANKGKRGFTYSHKPVDHGDNAAAIRDANAQGFTINLSADNLAEADQLSDAGVGPVVVVLPAEVQGNVDITTPKGRRVAVCPATYLETVSCATCQLCQRQGRKVIIGFPAHGNSKAKASAIAMSK